MKTINSWDDMRQYGLILLTGEACGLCMRLLFDLTKEGCDLVNEFFGGHAMFKEGTNWNHSNGAIASILLPRCVLPELAAFALHKEGFPITAHRKDGMITGMHTQEELDEFKEYYELRGLWKTSRAPGTGLRNMHMMSGRTT